MLSGPTSYPSTLDQFLSHWAAVNAKLAAGAGLLTRGGATRADLVGLRADLEAAANGVEDLLNGKEIARGEVENAKRAVLGRSQEFGRRLRGILAVDSPFLKALRGMPALTAAQNNFLRPARELADLWDRVVADGTPVVLAGSYTLVAFRADLEALEALYETLNEAVLDLKLTRERRNGLQREARAILSAYRPAVEGLFAPDSPLVVAIPLLYRQGGHTPAAVVAVAVYDAVAGEAVVSFTESAEGEVASYQLRGVAGAVYKRAAARVLATIPRGGRREFRTNFALGEAGTAASFKVYVMLRTRNEAGSKAVTVARG